MSCKLCWYKMIIHGEGNFQHIVSKLQGSNRKEEVWRRLNIFVLCARCGKLCRVSQDIYVYDSQMLMRLYLYMSNLKDKSFGVPINRKDFNMSPSSQIKPCQWVLFGWNSPHPVILKWTKILDEVRQVKSCRMLPWASLGISWMVYFKVFFGIPIPQFIFWPFFLSKQYTQSTVSAVCS